MSAATHHALWDSWVHERDVLLPLGLSHEIEEDEVVACLRYVAGLGPALARCRGVERTGTYTVEATNPALSILVDVDTNVSVRSATGDSDLHLAGDAVALLEGLSMRRPLGHTVPANSAWILAGLSETFDQGD